MTNTETAAELPTPGAVPADEPADLMRYVATINVPGYSPMADEPATFATAEDAWSYLAGERERAEDELDDESGEYSSTVVTLLALANNRALPQGAASMVDARTLCGTVYGTTPGYDGSHDLGLAYSVTEDDTLSKAADAVVKGYAEAMLWANAVCDVEDCADRAAGSDCEHSNGARDRFELSDFSEADQQSMRVDVHAMILGPDEDGADFLAYLDAGRDAEHFGHDFALTRNGHGAGYWDRGLGALGDKLTEWAQSYGESSVYVSEDGVTLS